MGVDAESYYVKHAGYCMDMKLFITLLTIVPSSSFWKGSILLAFKLPWVIEKKLSNNIPLIEASCFVFWHYLTPICGFFSSVICLLSCHLLVVYEDEVSHLLLFSTFLFVLPSLIFRHLYVLASSFIIVSCYHNESNLPNVFQHHFSQMLTMTIYTFCSYPN